MGRNENAPAGGGRGGKSKKKGFTIAEDEYLIGTELLEDAVVSEEKVAPAPVKNKGKKGGKKNEPKDDEDYVREEEAEEKDAVIKFTGQKKSKGKNGGSSSTFSASSFGLLGDDGEDGHEKMGKDDEDELDVPAIAFSGKKKPSKSKKNGSSVSSAFDLLGEEEESRDKDESSKEEDEDAEITFTGKKKKSSKGLKKPSGNSFSFAFLDEENDEDESVSKVGDDLGEGGSDDQEADASALKFSGKKKSSKKKNPSADTALETANGDTSSNLVEPPQYPDISKSKTKKKKGGKTRQEEEDLDQILAEFGVAPPVHVTSFAEKEAVEGIAETVSKKKKKKKDKEKKGAAAKEKQEETKTETSIVPGKKVPKHVREMQERLAKQRELEERKQREEEERLRKEEEERLQQEGLERLAEEKKRLKKEREKEKILKKKQEEKLRLEAMRIQFLANASLPLAPVSFNIYFTS